MLQRYVNVLGIDIADVLCYGEKNNIVFQMTNNKNANGVVFNNGKSESEKDISDQLNQIKEEIVQIKNIILKINKK